MMLAALALAASAPSFDCKKASIEIEKKVCGDEVLARSDQAVAVLFRSIRKQNPKAAREQRDWLADRNGCKYPGCLLDSYEARVSDLLFESNLGRKYSNGPYGTLSILPLGDDWYAFRAQNLWVGSVPGAVNDAEASGVFKLMNGRGSRPPQARYDCGWRIQKLPRNRWKLEDWPGTDGPACGGLNASVEGVYSR